MSWLIPLVKFPNLFLKVLTICTAFLWNRRPPRVALETLHPPSHMAGLALPNFYLYYLASQLVNIHDWLHPNSNNACTTTEGAIVSSFETLHNIVYRGSTPLGLGVSIVRTSLSLFQTVVAKLSTDSWMASPNGPL